MGVSVDDGYVSCSSFTDCVLTSNPMELHIVKLLQNVT